MNEGFRQDAAGAPILVVDDESPVRGLFVRCLRDAGYTTLEAADGLAALQVLESERVALVLLDSRMPGLDGPGVIRAVRARPGGRTLPIIMVTASAGLDERVRGLEGGADEFLTKPVAVGELLALVGAQLRSHAAWTETISQEAEARRAAATAIREAEPGLSPEETAASIVTALRPVLEPNDLAILAFTAGGGALPLAVGASRRPRFQVGVPIRSGLAARLYERAAAGPWIERAENGTRATAEAGGEIGYVPLRGSSGALGLLAISTPAASEQRAGALARWLPILVEIGDLVSARIGPGLQQERDLQRGQRTIAACIADQAYEPIFQPIVRLADRSIVGFEALTRFVDGTPPAARFAEAARLGLGHELEAATLEAAVAAARSLPADAFLALNVSPSLVLLNASPHWLRAAGARPVVLELTEHAPVDDYAALTGALSRLVPRPRLAVDDAGSGYSSLRHIFTLRPSFVKLDQSWVNRIDGDAARQALVAGLVHMADKLGAEVIGEGIERPAELATLAELGVTYGQGYLLGRSTRLRRPDSGWVVPVRARGGVLPLGATSR